MTEDQIKHMVNRFLGWRLPKNFSPDAGISFKADFNEHTAFPMKNEPIGTNLFDATQADAMVRYLIEGMPGAAQGSGGCGAELFCDWLRGYFAGLAGKDELTAREANQIRNTLNSLGPSSIPSTNSNTLHPEQQRIADELNRRQAVTSTDRLTATDDGPKPACNFCGKSVFGPCTSNAMAAGCVLPPASQGGAA